MADLEASALGKRYAIEIRQAAETAFDIFKAGRRLLEAQRRVPWSLKPDGSFVTALDREIEDRLRESLERRFPGWEFIGEESATADSGTVAGRPRIILDPIDGTAAYARGLNFFAISLALVDAEGAPVLAVLHLPGMGRWFVATFGEAGAVRHDVEERHGGVELRPTALRPAADAGATFSRDAYLWLGSDPHRQVDLSRWEGKVRALGATASHLGLLLDDTIDPIAAVVTRYKIWDVAAGLALAEAAGLEARDLRAPETPLTLQSLLAAADTPPFVVARPRVLAALLPVIGLIPSRA